MSKVKKLNIPTKNTRTTILTHLLDKDLSAIDLSEILGINESGIRRHLNILEERGYIRHYFKKAGRGRPKKLFTLTSSGRKLFPRKGEVLLEVILEELQEKYNKEELNTFLSDAAEKLKTYYSINEDKNLEDRLQDLVKAFDDFGFFPTLHKEDNTYVIDYRNCAFDLKNQELVPLLCKLHIQLLQNLLDDVEIQQEKSFLRKDKICRHRILLKAQEG